MNGLGLALAVEGLMAVGLLYVLLIAAGARWLPVAGERWAGRAIPVLAALTLCVAGYLTYVELSSNTAVCGPVGDCNAVQSSPYAHLFGVLPVGLLGAGGDLAILAAWLVGWRGTGRAAQAARLLLFGMALFGTLFSMYLTYLEIWVIRAVCIWCLSSALLTTLIMVFAAGAAQPVVNTDGAE